MRSLNYNDLAFVCCILCFSRSCTVYTVINSVSFPKSNVEILLIKVYDFKFISLSRSVIS